MKDTVRETFETGAERCKDVAGSLDKPCRYDLISHVALRRLAETYAEGAEKYGAGNWRKGIPMENLMNHALAHLVAYSGGDRNEDHLAHAVWNLATMMHFEELPAAAQLVKADIKPIWRCPDCGYMGNGRCQCGHTEPLKREQ